MSAVQAKACSSCGEQKPLDQFSRDRSKAYGAASACRACHRRYRERKYSDPVQLEARRELSRQFRREHPEKYKRSVRSATLKAKYGISADDYDRLLAAQGGVCAICGADNPGVWWGKHLHVDHDHATGRIRGLLCQPCNTTLGKLKDDPALLRRAAEYLERGGVTSNS